MPNKTNIGPSSTNGWILLNSQNQNIILNSNNTVYLNYLPNKINFSGTIAFWFYYTNKSQLGNIVSLCSSNSYINIQLIYSNNNIILSLRTLNGSSGGKFVEIQFNNNSLIINTWYHFAVVYNRAIDHNHQSLFISNYYINGAYVSSGDNTLFPSSDLRINNYIGAVTGTLMAGLSANSYVGGFSDLRMYLRGLSSAEINQIYNKA